MKKIIVSLILIIFCSLLYAMYIEPDLFKINTYQIKTEVPDSFKDLKIVHFSDTLINYSYTIDELKNLVKRINNLKPDIIFFTGDLIDSNYKISDEEKKVITDSLKSLKVNLFKYSIYGDNDLKNQTVYEEIMKESEFTLLNNESQLLFYKDLTPITITGLTNTTDIEKAYSTDENINSSLNITLIHKPDSITSLVKSDVVLGGHYLGGYINIPFYGPIIKKEGAETYCDKYFVENKTQMFVSNGIGTENFNIRFMNIPSINVYRFE